MLRFGFWCSGILHKSAAAFLAQPVAVATDGDHLAVVQEPVEDGGGHHRVSEHRVPLADAAVRGDQHRPPLVAPRDQLEEQMRGVGLERQLAELIDDQKLGLGEQHQPLRQPAFGMALGDLGDKGDGRHKQGGIAGEDRLATERDGKMRLAHPGRAQQQQVVAMGDPAAGGEIADLPRVDRRLARRLGSQKCSPEREALCLS